MSENFYTILTATGKAKLANSAVLGSKVNFKTLKVGDGNGAYYEPTESQTSLVREVWSGNVSSISVDENNPNWIVAETLIPATIGGFFIREAGIFDEDGDLIAISKLSETYKPVVSEGSIKDLCIKIVLEVSNVSSVTLKIDPTVIVATRKDIDVLQAKMDASNAQTAEEIKELDSKLSEQISELANEISNKTVVTPAVGYGMNNVIKNVGETSVSPKFNIQGKTVINLLGKDGNCEDVSKFSLDTCTAVLDSTNKVFGGNSIKFTLSGTGSNNAMRFNIQNLQNKLEKTKYYCMSAYIRNYNITSGINQIRFGINGGDLTTQKVNSTPAPADKFVRVWTRIQPSDIASVTSIEAYIWGYGTAGQCGWVDAVMIEEITSEQYADTNFTPSPYVHSYSCLQNPYIEVRHDNLVRNGNGEEGIAWWNEPNKGGNISLVNGYIQLTFDGIQRYFGLPLVPVKPTTTYSFSITVKAGTHPKGIYAYINQFDYFGRNGSPSNLFATTVTSTNDTVLTGTFTTAYDTTQIVIAFTDGSLIAGSGTNFVKNIMLVEGTTSPTAYKPCRIERCVVEGKFADGDSLVLENGEVTGQINWKHRTLFGKDYGYTFNGDRTGFKAIQIPLTELIGLQAWSANNVVVTKYDGKILLYSGGVTTTDSKEINSDNFVIGVTDTDTGWAETINPNNDEVKAFMNGWKAMNNTNNRYVSWININVPYSYTDITCRPQGTFSTLTIATSGTTSVTIADSSMFAVGDNIAVSGNSVTTVSSISGNTLTLAASQPYAPVGTVVFRLDNGTTDTRILSYCKNNVAPNYDGYQLHYKLSTPEQITDDNCHIHGDIPKLDVGDNYLLLDSGSVLNEVANPQFHNASDYQYKINSNYYDDKTSSYLKNKTEIIYSIFRNGLWDSMKWLIKSQYEYSAYGNCGAYITSTNFDSRATYTVDYKILSTIAPQIGSFICNYEQDIVTVINDIEESVNNKQTHDSILDTVVDKSIYEVINEVRTRAVWSWTGGSSYNLDFFINMTPKKCMPLVTIQDTALAYWNGFASIRCRIPMNGMLVYKLSDTCILIRTSIVDSTIINAIKNYGIEAFLIGVTLDCKGRI